MRRFFIKCWDINSNNKSSKGLSMTQRIIPINGKKKCSCKECTNSAKDENGLILLELFAIAKGKSCGRSSWCKECLEKKAKQKRKENPEKEKERWQRQKEKMMKREKVHVDFKKCGKPNCINSSKDKNGMLPALEFGKNKHTTTGLTSYCKACFREDRNKYLLNNKEKERERHRKYIHKNREKHNAYSKWYRENFPEKRNQTKKNWEDKNPGYHNTYSKNRMRIDPGFRLASSLRKRLGEALKSQLAGKRKSAVRDLGCSMKFFVKYMESKFLPGMSWDNYGKGKNKWNIDHIIPISSFNLVDPIEQAKAVHYTNLQPLWEIDNIKKGNKILQTN